MSLPTALQSPSHVVFLPPLDLDPHLILYTPFANAPVEQCPTSRKRKLLNIVLPTHAPLHSIGGTPRNLAIDIPTYHPQQGLQPCSEGITIDLQVTLLP